MQYNIIPCRLGCFTTCKTVNYVHERNLYRTEAQVKQKCQDKNNAQANVWNILVVNEKMSDQVAYNVVKTIFEHKAEWEAVHKSAAEVLLENQKQANSPVPFHPGALKYFAEKGIKLTN